MNWPSSIIQADWIWPKKIGGQLPKWPCLAQNEVLHIHTQLRSCFFLFWSAGYIFGFHHGHPQVFRRRARTVPAPRAPRTGRGSTDPEQQMAIKPWENWWVVFLWSCHVNIVWLVNDGWWWLMMVNDGIYLVGGLVAMNFIFPLILGFDYHPNWRTHIFQRGG